MSEQPSWKAKGKSEEAQYICEKEKAQLDAIRNDQKTESQAEQTGSCLDRDFESGFGGQEDLEDRYATTSGEH